MALGNEFESVYFKLEFNEFLQYYLHFEPTVFYMRLNKLDFPCKIVSQKITRGKSFFISLTILGIIIYIP